MQVIQNNKVLSLIYIALIAIVETMAFFASIDIAKVNLALEAVILVSVILITIYRYGCKEVLRIIQAHKTRFTFLVLFTIGLCSIALVTPIMAGGLSYFWMIQIVIIAAVVLSVMGIFVWKVEPWVLFVIIGGLMGLGMMLILPIGAVPDEPAHLQSAYHVSNVILGIQGDGEGILMMRADDAIFQQADYGIAGYTSLEQYQIYLNNVFTPLSNAEMITVENVPTVSPYFPYIFSGIGITLGRLFGLGSYMTFLLGRFFNLAFYVTLCAFALKIMTFGHLPLMGLLLMPMSLQQGMSYSYDVVVHGMSFVLIAYTTRIVSKMKLKKYDYVIMVLSSLMLWPLKSHAYFLICFMPFLFMVRNKFNWSDAQKAKAWKYVLWFILAVCIVVCIWGVTGARNFAYEPNILGYTNTEGYSIAYFIAHPFELPIVFARTLASMYVFYPNTFVGQKLAWLNLELPTLITMFYLILLFFVSIKRLEDKDDLDRSTKRLFLAIGILVVLMIEVGMLINWSPVADGIVQGVQGRYFIPVAVLFMMVMKSDKLQISKRMDSYLLAFLLLGCFVSLEWILLKL